jgi:hypothetical protein
VFSLFFCGKASTHLAYQFVTVKTVYMGKIKSINFVVFLTLNRENDCNSDLDFHLLRRRTKSFSRRPGNGRTAKPSQPLLHLRHNNRPIWQQNDEIHLAHRSFDPVRKAHEPKRSGRCPKFLRFQRSDLHVIKSRLKIGGDLCRFLFCYGIGRILFATLKDVSNVPPSLAAPR